MQPGRPYTSLKGSAEGLQLTEEEKQIQIDRKFNSSQRGPNHKETDLNFNRSPGFCGIPTQRAGQTHYTDENQVGLGLGLLGLQSQSLWVFRQRVSFWGHLILSKYT